MMWRDDPMVRRQRVEPGPVGLEPFARVKEQDGTPLPFLFDLQTDAGDGDVMTHADTPFALRDRTYASWRARQLCGASRPWGRSRPWHRTRARQTPLSGRS